MHDLVFVIDADVRRRASITYYLNNNGIFAEPYETIDEFVRSWSKSGIVLIHDDEQGVSSLVQQITSRHSWLPIVAFSEAPLPSQIVDAVLDGAIGYAVWPARGELLTKTLLEAASRTGAVIASGSRQALATARIARLSRREREILAGMAEGLSNRLIGGHLGISPRTVELHRSNLLAKIDARHSAEAIRLAIEASLPAFEPSMTPANANSQQSAVGAMLVN
ncbi:LuxR C-terminal-related transcriptional regulator [Novosphingobium sp. G106]|uniref:response regulator transcription factor n=1 Tax=Novosphingobium sp. G106 TaxID=2849500 RepID=UPI001C2DAFEC|nr:LuxR C-terminal-related transcriptional regulator [Novosphingobium sp. G106]MBV1690353.1 LuxR C-terminal-related transcriptional regulator [Novosphingobium sp. G106]